MKEIWMFNGEGDGLWVKGQGQEKEVALFSYPAITLDLESNTH